MKKILTIVILAALSLLVLGSCKKPKPNNDTVVVDASAHGQWKYFSFEQGKVVTVNDPKTSKDWDLGICRYNMVTNGPEGMSGKGAAYETNVDELSADIKVPDASEFKGNGWGIIALEFPMDNISKSCTLDQFNEKYAVHRVNSVLTQPYYQIKDSVSDPKPVQNAHYTCLAATQANARGEFIHQTGAIYWVTMPPPAINVNPHVFIIRTANGKHAAVKFIDYKKDEKSGIVTFKYIYPLD